MEMTLFVDSGAPSLYNQFIRRNKGGTYMGSFLEDRKNDDFSWIQSKDFQTYRRNYALFIKKNLQFIDYYANFDVINNAEATWSNQQYYESKGLKPIPVWHYGTDMKWLEMYLEKGYDYIAIGGLIPNPPRILLPALDSIWGSLLTDSSGMPKVKVHGFAVTSTRLIARYPWFSVDSSSWVKFGQYGVICVPPKRGGKFDYSTTAHNIFVSTRSPSQEITGKHYYTLSGAEQAMIDQYLDLKGHVMGKSEFKMVGSEYELKEDEVFVSGRKGDEERRVEIILERGVCNDYKLRDELNVQYYIDLQNSVPEWPWAFQINQKKGFFEI